jgi:hypothetical protein
MMEAPGNRPALEDFRRKHKFFIAQVPVEMIE